MQRFRSAFGVDNSEALVNQDGAFIKVNTAPIQAAMTLPLPSFARHAAELCAYDEW